jgi:hypothetical protein
MATATTAAKPAAKAEVAPVPIFPAPPSTWNPATALTYAASLVLFILGVLTLAGVTLPSGVSGEVQAWAGIIPTGVAALMPLWVLLSKHSVQKTALKAGIPPETAMRL